MKKIFSLIIANVLLIGPVFAHECAESLVVDSKPAILDYTDVPPFRTVSCFEAIKDLDHVLFLMQKRLAIMHEVARYKWNHGLPISDNESEKAMAARALLRAKKCGLPSEWAESFVGAQVVADRLIQTQDFKIWRSRDQKTFEEESDLAKEVYPYLDDLMTEIIDTMGRLYPKMQDEEKRCLTLQPPLSCRQTDVIVGEAWNQAILPLQSVYDFKKQLRS